jgi:hypothetical protein
MALPFTNGNIIANSFTANINGTVYVVNTATLDAPAESVVVTNENSTPTAAYHFRGGLRTGTAELQVNLAAAQQDLQGLTFVTTAFTNSNVNLVVTSQSMPVAKGTARVYNIGIAEVI